jgi:hypothetical protein
VFRSAERRGMFILFSNIQQNTMVQRNKNTLFVMFTENNVVFNSTSVDINVTVVLF